jgi:hypothetical protein
MGESSLAPRINSQCEASRPRVPGAAASGSAASREVRATTIRPRATWVALPGASSCPGDTVQKRSYGARQIPLGLQAHAGEFGLREHGCGCLGWLHARPHARHQRRRHRGDPPTVLAGRPGKPCRQSIDQYPGTDCQLPLDGLDLRLGHVLLENRRKDRHQVAAARLRDEAMRQRFREREGIAAWLRQDQCTGVVGQPVELTEKERKQHVLPALEIPIDIGLGETGARGNRAEAGARRPLKVKELARGCQQALTAKVDLRAR